MGLRFELMKKRKRNFVAVGHVKVPWCRLGDGRTTVDPRKYGRKRQTFTDHDAALLEARKLAIEINGGGTEAHAFTAADRATFAHANAEVAKHDVDLVAGITEWSAQRTAIAGSGHALDTIVQAGLTALRRVAHPVSDVAREFIKSKAGQDLDGRYLRGIESTWMLMAERFSCDIREVTSEQLGGLLNGLRKRDGDPLGSRRRDNILDEIRQGFQFARLRGYLPDEISAARKVPTLHKLGAPISFFTVVEMRLILEHVAEEWLPLVVLACFCGTRTGELALSKDAKKSKDPLRWDDFDWEEREIHIRAETSKIGKARIIPLLDNAYEWLLPHRRETGPIAPRGARPDREFGKGSRLELAVNQALTAAPRLKNERPVQLQMEAIDPAPLPLLTEFAWRNNALRHSYGSYRATIIRNLHQLADEMGNSPEICARHYRNPRPKAQARAWFDVRPKPAANIITLAEEEAAYRAPARA
ncbi:MAG TPA: site-specific integrase [Methylovirgula sp.]